MITSIGIENLRGIRSGRLDGLTPLTVLTGPNACGKSTVLDALLVAASPHTAKALGEAIQRHPAVLGGARWMFGEIDHPAVLDIEADSGEEWHLELRWSHSTDEGQDQRLREQDARAPFFTISFQGDIGSGRTGFSTDNRFVGHTGLRNPAAASDLVLVDPGLPIPLHRLFTASARAGRRGQVYELLSALVPQFDRLEILTEDDDTPSLYLTSAGRSVPIGLAGDGVQAFVQLALDVAVLPDGLVLVEEPEVYQHPKAIWQTAKVFLANMRRGVQVVLTTHSLEMIDALVAEAGDDLEKLSVFNLLLEEGELKSGRRVGEEIAFARQTLENDLR